MVCAVLTLVGAFISWIRSNVSKKAKDAAEAAEQRAKEKAQNIKKLAEATEEQAMAAAQSAQSARESKELGLLVEQRRNEGYLARLHFSYAPSDRQPSILSLSSLNIVNRGKDVAHDVQVYVSFITDGFITLPRSLLANYGDIEQCEVQLLDITAWLKRYSVEVLNDMRDKGLRDLGGKITIQSVYLTRAGQRITDTIEASVSWSFDGTKPSEQGNVPFIVTYNLLGINRREHIGYFTLNPSSQSVDPDRTTAFHRPEEVNVKTDIP